MVGTTPTDAKHGSFNRIRQVAPICTAYVWVYKVNGISIGSAVFAWLKVVTDKQTTLRTTSVAIVCISAGDSAQKR